MESSQTSHSDLRIAMNELRDKKSELLLKQPITTDSVPYVIWQSGRTVMINFQSTGCMFGNCGYCLACDYGRSGQNVDCEGCLDGLSKVLDIFNQNNNLTELVIGAYGSVFDKREISDEVLDSILDFLSNQDRIQNIIFETHYTTIIVKILDKLRYKLVGKRVSIEFGLESVNEDVLVKSYSKYMDLYDFKLIVNQVKTYGFGVLANIMFGAPFLSKEEQKQDVINSVRWAFDNRVNAVVLFPVNIKPDTYLYELYNQGKYKRVSNWDLIELLKEFTPAELSKISLSWIGDRQNLPDEYTNPDLGHTELRVDKWKRTLSPITCNKCKEITDNFYIEYRRTRDGKARKKLVDNTLKLKECSC